MTVHKFESSRKTTVEINEYKHIKRKNMKNNPQKKILRQDGFPIGAEMAKKRYSSAGTTTPFLKQLILTILLFAILPVTALAAEGAPNTLYVGNMSLPLFEDSYWATNDSGELTRVNDATDDSNDWNVKYDPSTATLTLKDAKISGSFHQYNNPSTAGIYAKGSSKQPVALTIELIGTNTITGNYGIFVDAEQGETVGTNASLLIRNSSDNGILEVSGSSYGIYVKSGTGNASLNINDASVVAKTTQTSSGYAGVCVQSSIFATSSPKLSLAVDGGSLTASGTEGNDGIQFYVGDPSATNATTSLTVSNNAIVRANGSAGGITSNSSTGIQYETGSDSTGGIVFDGKNGTVYGSVTLQDDLTISEGESLTIGNGASLTVSEGSTLINNGTIDNSGTLTNEGTIILNGLLTGEDVVNDGTMQENASYIYYEIENEKLSEPKSGEKLATVVTEGVTEWGENGQEHWYVVNGEITINSRVTVTGKVHLILADGCSLTASYGIKVSVGNSLTIYGQTDGSGALEATGDDSHAGIGSSSYGDSGGEVTIHGGTVNASGTRGGAGIGGGELGSGGEVTIYGGTVNATSYVNGAGIGGGALGSGGEVTIYGGMVTASSEAGGGAGIGGGDGGSGGTVAIYGGTVNARSDRGAGIGNGGALGSGGEGGSGGTVAIYGGTVNATSNNGAGIGNGDGGSGCSFSTGTDGHAFIIASSISDQSKKGSWSGVIFEGDNGAVYGSQTLEKDLTIETNQTLTIVEDATLTIVEDATLTISDGATLTNKGTIIVYGELTGKVEGEGSIPITGITLDQTTLSLDVDETATLQATIKPSIATDKDLTWSSSDSDVATVKNGEVTAVAVGKTDITVTTQDGGYTATCEVTVKQHTHSLTKTDYKAPTCTEDGNIEYWTCSVCGKYFSDEAGTTEISLDETVIYATGHHYVNGTCTVCGADDPDYVEPEPEPEPEPTYYRVDLRPVEGATVILSADEVEEGGTLTFTIEIAEGYVADDLMVTVSQGIGKAVEVKPDEAGVYTVKEVDGLVTITVYGVTEEPATAIERVETLRIYAAEGILHVETPTRQRVTIVSMAGALIADGEQEGARIYRDLNAGVYIVRVGDYATKVRVE